MFTNSYRTRTVILPATITVLAMLLFTTAACGAQRGSSSQEADLFRNPHPTFTPTGGAPVSIQPATNSGVQPAQSAGVLARTDSEAQQLSLPTPNATEMLIAETVPDESPTCVVNAPLVNLRAESNARSDVVDMVERGSEFEIIGRSNDDQWWQVCCQDGQEVWISQELVDTIGDVDQVKVTDAVASEPVPPNAGGPVSDTGAGTTNSDPEARLELESKEQFSEQELVRIFAYIHDSDLSLPGYGLRITKDGQEIPTSGSSFGGQPAFTWPFQDTRQRYYNLKIEIDDISPVGTWAVQPVNAQGAVIGPSAEFTLQANDTNMELYVRYQLIN